METSAIRNVNQLPAVNRNKALVAELKPLGEEILKVSFKDVDGSEPATALRFFLPRLTIFKEKIFSLHISYIRLFFEKRLSMLHQR